MELKVNNILVNGKIYEICPDWDNIKNVPNIVLLNDDNEIPIEYIPKFLDDIVFGRLVSPDTFQIINDPGVLPTVIKGEPDKLYVDNYDSDKTTTYIWCEEKLIYKPLYYQTLIDKLVSDLYDTTGNNEKSIEYIVNEHLKWNDIKNK